MTHGGNKLFLYVRLGQHLRKPVDLLLETIIMQNGKGKIEHNISNGAEKPN